jgi:DNA-binding NarL/FixJ family response regulator
MGCFLLFTGFDYEETQLTEDTCAMVGVLGHDSLSLCGLMTLLQGEALIKNIVWKTTKSHQALSFCADARRSKPDVLLLDMELYDMPAIEVCRRVIRIGGIAVLCMTSLPLAIWSRKVSEAGAQGLVRKGDGAEIITALRTVAMGRIWNKGCDGVDFDTVCAARSRADSMVDSIRPLLSTKERQVLKLYSQGYKASEIAAAMGCKTGTVKTHLRRAELKLHTRSRGEVIAKWQKM